MTVVWSQTYIAEWNVVGKEEDGGGDDSGPTCVEIVAGTPLVVNLTVAVLIRPVDLWLS